MLLTKLQLTINASCFSYKVHSSQLFLVVVHARIAKLLNIVANFRRRKTMKKKPTTQVMSVPIVTLIIAAKIIIKINRNNIKKGAATKGTTPGANAKESDTAKMYYYCMTM